MTAECIYPGCARPRGKALGYCDAHYARQLLGRDMEPPIRDANATDAERFWSKVNKTEGCWNWTGALVNVSGYGLFRINGGNTVAHRVSYLWAHGSIPKGAEVDHMCFNRSCVNPDHLRLLSHSQNGQNRASANSNSKSGIRGVYWSTDRRVWLARAVIMRVTHEVGAFTELEDAEKAITEWRRIHMPASINDQRKAS